MINSENKIHLLHISHQIVQSLVTVILSLFFWQSLGILQLLLFRIFEISVIPVVAPIAGWIIDKFSIKTAFMIGFITLAVQLLMLISGLETITTYFLPFSFLAGISAVFRFQSLNLLVQQNIPQNNQAGFFNSLNQSQYVLNILFPLISGLVIFTFGYQPLFIIGLISITMLLILISNMEIKVVTDIYQPLAIFKNWDRNSWALLLTNLFWGGEFALITLLIPIIISQKLGGELGWGIASAVLSLIAIIFSWIVRKKLKTHRVALVGVLGFLMSAVSLVFAVEASTFLFFSFLSMLYIWQSTQSIALKPAMNRIMATFINSQHLQTEYSIFTEFPFMIGQLIMLSLLLATHHELESAPVLTVFFLLLSLMALYETRSLFFAKPNHLENNTQD